MTGSIAGLRQAGVSVRLNDLSRERLANGKREFIAFWMSGGRVVAGMNVIWDVNDAIQALIRSGQPADPARLADPAVPLEEAVAR